MYVISNFTGSIEGVTVCTLLDRARWGLLAYPLSVHNCKRYLQELNPDVVHIHYIGGSSLFAPALRRLSYNFAIFATPWGSDVFRSGVFKRFLIRRLLTYTDRVLTTSPSMVSFLHYNFKIPNQKMASYSWGVDLKLFNSSSFSTKLLLRRELGLPESGYVVFSNRVIAPVYRSEILLRAFQFARRHENDMHLVLLEGAPATRQIELYRLHIKEMASSLGESVTLIKGTITPASMSAYLKSADVVVGIPISDQRSTSTLEALACCPSVILSDVPAFRELRSEGYDFTLVYDVKEESVCKALLLTRHESYEKRQKTLLHNNSLIQEQEDAQKQALKIEEEYYNILLSKSRLTKNTENLFPVVH